MNRLYLGAGKDRKEGFTHVDMYPFPGIDIVCDIEKGLPLEDSVADYVYSQDFMEHLHPEKKVFVINEIWRVLKPGGRMEHYIPNAGSRNDFGSPSHLSHWNLQQFEHFDVDSYRYELDKDYEGFIGGFRKIYAAEISSIQEHFGMFPQSIHVIYQAVK
jgi:SAM-dependent methyltransferase